MCYAPDDDHTGARRLGIATLLLLALVPLVAFVASAVAGTVNGLTTTAPIASSYCTASSLGSSSALCTIPAGAVCAFVTATGANLNWRDDGTAATASVGTGGQQLLAGASMWYCGALSSLRFIQQSATGALSVSYYK